MRVVDVARWLAPSRLMRSVLVLAVLLTACSFDTTYLLALMAVPMASYEADGIVLIDSCERAEEHSLVTDKPVHHAEVGRTYQILDQSRAEQLVAEAAAVAESDGWRFRGPP